MTCVLISRHIKGDSETTLFLMVVLTELASPNDVRHFAVAGKVLGAFRMGTNLQNKIKLKYDLIHLKASGINGMKKERSEKVKGRKPLNRRPKVV